MVLVGAYAYTHATPGSSSVSNANDSAIRAFVVDFGSKFKNVSLLAPDAAEQIAREYGSYASPELIAQWQANTAEAPGRQTSSPWPDRIEVVSVTPAASGDAFETYQVEGNVIEVTSADTPNEPAAVQPISLTVIKQGNTWLITALSKGAYSDLPQRSEITGTWECLPHKDTTGPQTTECAFGIAADQGGHYAVDTSLMATYPVDFATGARVRAAGMVTPVEMLNSVQKYDIVGIMRATTIEKI